MIDAFHKTWCDLNEKWNSVQYTPDEKIKFAREGRDYLHKWFHPGEVENKYLPRIENLIEQFESERDAKSKRARLGGGNKDNVKKKSLKNIWQLDSKRESTFDQFINILKSENPVIGGPFIIESKDGLHWNESIRGHRQYLAAFIYQMTEKKWIGTYYSAPEYVSILSNTFKFNKRPNTEPFKSLNGTPPEDKYQEPFKNLPTNI